MTSALCCANAIAPLNTAAVFPKNDWQQHSADLMRRSPITSTPTTSNTPCPAFCNKATFSRSYQVPDREFADVQARMFLNVLNSIERLNKPLTDSQRKAISELDLKWNFNDTDND